jgi:hypothetical protein
MPGIPGGPGGGIPGGPGGGIPGGPPSGIPGGGIPGGPGGRFGRPSEPPGIPESVWTCGNCGKEIARGNFKPTTADCPHCGVRFDNTIGGMMENQKDRAEELRKRFEDRNRSFNSPAGNPFTSSPTGAPAANTSAYNAGRTMGVILVAVAILVVMALGAGGLIWLLYSTAAKTSRRPKRRRRRPIDDYDD